MTDPPQRRPSAEQSGGCLCGAVRYRIRAAPLSSAHCHCRSCQKATGAAFATWARVDGDGFEVTRGRLAVFASSPGVSRGFCGDCGSTLTYAADAWPGEVHVTVATLDQPDAITPTAHVYLEHRLAAVRLDDGLPGHQRFR